MSQNVSQQGLRQYRILPADRLFERMAGYVKRSQVAGATEFYVFVYPKWWNVRDGQPTRALNDFGDRTHNASGMLLAMQLLFQGTGIEPTKALLKHTLRAFVWEDTIFKVEALRAIDASSFPSA